MSLYIKYCVTEKLFSFWLTVLLNGKIKKHEFLKHFSLKHDIVEDTRMFEAFGFKIRDTS